MRALAGASAPPRTADEGVVISLMEPAFRVGSVCEGYVHGAVAPGSLVRLTCAESAKRVDSLENAVIRTDHLFGIVPVWQQVVHINESCELESGSENMAYFRFDLASSLPPSFRCYQHGVFLSCAYRLVVVEPGENEVAESFVHVVGQNRSAGDTPVRESTATKNVWLLPPKLRFGRLVFKLPVIFNITVPAALDAHAGAQLLIHMSTFTDIAPEYLKLSIWRKVNIWDRETGKELDSTSINVQRFKAVRPFVSGFEGTYFVNVPKRCCSFSSRLMDVSYTLKVVLSLGLGRKVRHHVPLHIHHLFAQTLADGCADGVKQVDWDGVHSLISQRGFPHECPICFEPFISCRDDASDSGQCVQTLPAPRSVSAAGVAERVYDMLSLSARRPPTPEDLEGASGGELDPATAALLNESELLREASVAPNRGAGGEALVEPAGGLVGSGAATAPLEPPSAAARRSTAPGRVENGAAQRRAFSMPHAVDERRMRKWNEAHRDLDVLPEERRSHTNPGQESAFVSPTITPWRGGAENAASPSARSDRDALDMSFAPEHAAPDAEQGAAASDALEADRQSASGLMAASEGLGESRSMAAQSFGLQAVESTLESSPLGVPGLLVTDCCHAFHASCLLMYEKFATLNTFMRPSCPVCRSVYRKHVARAATPLATAPQALRDV